VSGRRAGWSASAHARTPRPLGTPLLPGPVKHTHTHTHTRHKKVTHSWRKKLVNASESRCISGWSRDSKSSCMIPPALPSAVKEARDSPRTSDVSSS
jgi:hypothetical protein